MGYVGIRPFWKLLAYDEDLKKCTDPVPITKMSNS